MSVEEPLDLIRLSIDERNFVKCRGVKMIRMRRSRNGRLGHNRQLRGKLHSRMRYPKFYC